MKFVERSSAIVLWVLQHNDECPCHELPDKIIAVLPKCMPPMRPNDIGRARERERNNNTELGNARIGYWLYWRWIFHFKQRTIAATTILRNQLNLCRSRLIFVSFEHTIATLSRNLFRSFRLIKKANANTKYENCTWAWNSSGLVRMPPSKAIS